MSLSMYIEKVSLVVTGNSEDRMYVDEVGDLDPNLNYVVYNFTTPEKLTCIRISLSRDVSQKDIDSNPYFIKKTPGFSLKWNYNQHDVKPDKKYKDGDFNKIFQRYNVQ